MINNIKNELLKLEDFFESNFMHKVLASVIVFYTIILGVESSRILSDDTQYIFNIIDRIICVFFVIEIAVRIAVSRINFFKNGWNIFDFIVVVSSLFSSSGIAALRVLRVFRVTEIFHLSKSTRILVSSMMMSIPSLMHVLGILLLIFYVFTLAAYDLFNHTVPDLFGSFAKSANTLFVALLGEGVENALAKVSEHHKHGYLFFVAFIVMMSFIMLNLFFGIIVDALRRAVDDEEKSK